MPPKPDARLCTGFQRERGVSMKRHQGVAGSGSDLTAERDLFPRRQILLPHAHPPDAARAGGGNDVAEGLPSLLAIGNEQEGRRGERGGNGRLSSEFGTVIL